MSSLLTLNPTNDFPYQFTTNKFVDPSPRAPPIIKFSNAKRKIPKETVTGVINSDPIQKLDCSRTLRTNERDRNETHLTTFHSIKVGLLGDTTQEKLLMINSLSLSHTFSKDTSSLGVLHLNQPYSCRHAR